MKHISEVIASMPAWWKERAGVATCTVDGAAIVAKMAAEGELRFLDATNAPAKKERL